MNQIDKRLIEAIKKIDKLAKAYMTEYEVKKSSAVYRCLSILYDYFPETEDWDEETNER